MLEYKPFHTAHNDKQIEEFLAANSNDSMISNASTTVREASEEWMEELIQLFRDPLSIFDDLSMSLGKALPIHKKEFKFQTVDGEFTAKESMRFTREALRDRVEREEYSLPVPIFSQEFGWDYRDDMAIQVEGMGQIADAYRIASMYSVKNSLENMVLNGTESSINGQKATGLLNNPNVNNVTYTGENLNAADGDTWRNAIAAVLIALDDDNLVGKSVTLYVNPNDWTMAGLTRYNTYDGRTCAEFVRAQDRINDVKTVRKLAANTILAVVKERTCLEIPYALPPMIRPIGRVDERDEIAFITEAAASIAIYRDAKGHCGICKVTKA